MCCFYRRHYLNYEQFVRSWFQLADAWTSSIDGEEYKIFLEEVLRCLATEQEPGTSLQCPSYENCGRSIDNLVGVAQTLACSHCAASTMWRH